MLINKDQSNPHEVRIPFDDAAHKSFTGPVTMITFGSDQYMWKSDGPNGHPDPNEPPITKACGGDAVHYASQSVGHDTPRQGRVLGGGEIVVRGFADI